MISRTNHFGGIMKRGPYKDLSGQRFYDFTILRMEITKKSGPHEYRAICRCEKCGTEPITNDNEDDLPF
jgi:hypothetical protein